MAAIYILRKCKQVKVLPMNKRFVQNDLIFFHKIITYLINNLIPVKMPDYLSLFSGVATWIDYPRYQLFFPGVKTVII